MPDYNANIPQATDLLNASQNDMLENFQQLYTAINVNHVDFGLVNEGKHKWVTFPVDPNPISPVPVAADVIMQSTTSRFTNLPEIVVKRSDNLNYPITVRANITQNLISGWATLGGSNIVVKWGLISGTGIVIVEFPTNQGIPIYSANPYMIQIYPFSPNGFPTDVTAHLINIVTPNTFSVSCTQRTTTTATLVPFFYLAIGPT